MQDIFNTLDLYDLFLYIFINDIFI